jgi:N-hydroxyarylamine O-acetyltransferase
MISQNKLFDKYLELLKVEQSPPDLNLLRKIVKAHLIKVPFENISKLIYKKQGMNDIPDLSTFLDGIEKHNFGGTCYSNNFYLYSLLKHLGYDVKLCGADMKNPDVHLMSIVTIEGLEYIVDSGYAAPFFEPLPRDLNKDFVIKLGSEKYIVKPKDESGITKVEQYYDSKLQHWYTVKPLERKIDDFRKVIIDSYADDAVFMNAVRITKFSENGSIVLKNLYLTETINDESSTIKITLKDIPSVIQKKFGIPMEVVRKAVRHFNELKDIYS